MPPSRASLPDAHHDHRTLAATGPRTLTDGQPDPQPVRRPTRPTTTSRQQRHAAEPRQPARRPPRPPDTGRHRPAHPHGPAARQASTAPHDVVLTAARCRRAAPACPTPTTTTGHWPPPRRPRRSPCSSRPRTGTAPGQGAHSLAASGRVRPHPGHDLSARPPPRLRGTDMARSSAKRHGSLLGVPAPMARQNASTTPWPRMGRPAALHRQPAVRPSPRSMAGAPRHRQTSALGRPATHTQLPPRA
ncbi:hypothetical protein SAMN05660976_00285 [Nonomuraea pusilla]|uniref:Uncharacterized protein n=1 Tax=Nonomuraea pusilla TaxID=46177 RepID=A0A1H7GBB6_9ACTN|nr:hypothetical protein SAMN05660976_00285 [Nonomuraea pusilla]